MSGALRLSHSKKKNPLSEGHTIHQQTSQIQSYGMALIGSERRAICSGKPCSQPTGRHCKIYQEEPA